jgi:hypothetical protein
MSFPIRGLRPSGKSTLISEVPPNDWHTAVVVVDGADVEVEGTTVVVDGDGVVVTGSVVDSGAVDGGDVAVEFGLLVPGTDVGPVVTVESEASPAQATKRTARARPTARRLMSRVSLRLVDTGRVFRPVGESLVQASNG